MISMSWSFWVRPTVLGILVIYTKECRNEILQATKEFGASIKQLSRLTGIGEKIIRNAKWCLTPLRDPIAP